MSEVNKALAEWVDVYKANEVKALMEPDAVQKLLDEYEAERRARQEAEAQAAALREALEWALSEGGWRLWYHADKEPPAIIDTSGGAGSPATIRTDAGKQYLAIVEAAREYVEAEQEHFEDYLDQWPERLVRRNEAWEALKAALGGDSQ